MIEHDGFDPRIASNRSMAPEEMFSILKSRDLQRASPEPGWHLESYSIIASVLKPFKSATKLADVYKPTAQPTSPSNDQPKEHKFVRLNTIMLPNDATFIIQ